MAIKPPSRLVVFEVLLASAICALGIYGYSLWNYPVMNDSSVARSQTTAPGASGYRVVPVSIGGATVAAQVADTSALQQLGLGDRDSLPAGAGMLFVFDTARQYAFWMKDMRFSIDIIWLDAGKRVVTIAQDLSPETYPKSFAPSAPALYVLEVPAGFSAAHGIKEGDRASF